MNTYYKYYPSVFLAKCDTSHKKGSVIQVTTKYGKENECEIFNLIFEKDGFYYYSIVRTDGFDAQERAKRKAQRYSEWAQKASQKSEKESKRAFEMTKGIPMGQPILVGHHSEKMHRNLLERSWNALGNSVKLSDKAFFHEARAAYWESRADEINLSMPESLEYYEFELEKAKQKHQALKNGTIERDHSFSLTYAKKAVNEIQKKLDIAQKLWGGNEESFICQGCQNEVSADYSIKTQGYCYLCDPNVQLEELLPILITNNNQQ